MRNFVAKHARNFNLATVQRDRTKFHRPSLVANTELYEPEFCEEDWGFDEGLLAPTKEPKVPSPQGEDNLMPLHI